MALYLNGTDLPQETYRSCDINYVIEELSKAMADNGSLFSYREASEGTALYFYGKSFDNMNNCITAFVNEYPLCQKCRIVQIA